LRSNFVFKLNGHGLNRLAISANHYKSRYPLALCVLGKQRRLFVPQKMP